MQDPAHSAAVDTVGHRDLVALRAGFDQWLATRWPQARLTAVSAPLQSGASSELVILDIEVAGGQTRWVARLQSAFPVYPHADLHLQAACMQAAADFSSAPVPSVFGVEGRSLNGIGAPFLLMEYREGRSAPDIPSYVTAGWLHDADPAAQREVWINGIRVIAALHATDWQRAEPAPWSLPNPGDTSLSRMLAFWEQFLALVAGEGTYPELESSVSWLLANGPDDLDDEGLVWGDASLRNMLFDDIKPCALLDFEFAHVGLRTFDIAFYALMDHVMAEGFAAGAPRLPGFPGIQATLDLYEEFSGAPVRHREYLLRMALTYMALSTTRVYQRLAAQNKVAADDVGRNPPLRLLGEVNSGRAFPA